MKKTTKKAKPDNFLDYKGYIGSIEVSVDDRVLYGQVQGIKSLLSYEGENIGLLEQDFKDRVDEYLEDCKSEGIEPQKPYTGNFNVRLQPETHKRAVLLAEKLGISLNKFMNQAVEDELQKNGALN